VGGPEACGVVGRAGYRAAEKFAEAGIPVTVVLDSAIGYIMERVSPALVWWSRGRALGFNA
jgi:hypothetical protein